MAPRFSVTRSRSAWRALLTAALVTLGGCGGDNLFQDPVGGFGEADNDLPSIRIVAPDSGHRVAVGDSILVEVDVSDNAGIAEIQLAGFALRGSAALGTAERIDRFEPKVINLENLEPMVRDTTISRYLVATADSVPEDTVFVVAAVRDVGNNQEIDTVVIRIGGPGVHIVSPIRGADVRAGADLRVHLKASEPEHRLESLRLFSTGTFATDTTLRFDDSRTSLDTIVDLTIPASTAPGDFSLLATARNSVNDSTTTQPLPLELLGPAEDTGAPSVRFSVAAPERAERNDSVAVTVIGTDEIRADRVGVTILPTHRLPAGPEPLTIVSRTLAADSTTFRVALSELGVPLLPDTSTVRLEITAFAIDAAGNCATATLPDTELSEACPETSPVVGIRDGATYDILVVRGRTIELANPGDRIADLAADDSNLYLSNMTRNRLEVLPIGATEFSDSIAVGSRPWGLAFNQDESRLYVANSGGTNISVVSPSSGSEVDRLLTPNVKLYDVPFEANLVPDTSEDAAPGDSVVVYYPNSVTRHDYSDRPQFIGVTQNENIIYSTMPTAAASDGTVRVLRTDQERLEIVTDYVEERIGSTLVIANADSAFLVPGSPHNLIRVCPRDRSVDPALDRKLGEVCFNGSIDYVEETIAGLGYDTRFLYSLDIEEVGLSDTTFVAVSGDHSTVAFGEGGTDNSRVMAFVDVAGQTNGPLQKFGEIRDLVGNTAERVFGLALNADGSLGIARGDDAYFFSPDLRLQGIAETEAGTGGIDMPADGGPTNRAFISGIDENGLAFIDVMDTFHFRQVARIFLRDPVIGPVRAVRDSDGSLRIYAVTARGLVSVKVFPEDL